MSCIPKQLLELLSDDVLIDKVLVRFTLKNIQNYDVENARVKFAVITDVFDLLLDLCAAKSRYFTR